MVRSSASIPLFLVGCVADDVYHHTQLLQTKMNSQKVSIDTSGDIHDEHTLFQKTMRTSRMNQTFLKAFGKFMKSHRQKPDQKPPDQQRPAAPDRRPNDADPEAMEACFMLYGHEVDMNKCSGCYAEAAPHYSDTAMMEDPNAMVRTLCDMADECMGQTNLITSTCEEHYGEDVPLFDCLMCGMECQCTMEGECAAGDECHPGCMAGDSDSSEFEDGESDDENAECKMFYGPEAEPEQCEECGFTCMTAANTAVDELAKSGAKVDMEDFERMWLETLMSCADECMAPLQNLPELACKTHYGEDVDVTLCFGCGMQCGCDLEGNCEWCDHGECMASAVSLVQNAEKKATNVHPMQHSKLHQRFQAAMTKLGRKKIIAKKQINDVTDLMQTRQHLKK